MNQNRDPTSPVDSPPGPPKAETPTLHLRTYDCANCRYTDAHGLTCGFCIEVVFLLPALQGAQIYHLRLEGINR